MIGQNQLGMAMMQFPVQNQNEIKREEIVRPYKEIIKQLENENKQLQDENDQLKIQLNQYQMNNMGNMGMINNQFNQFQMMNSRLCPMCNRMYFLGNQMMSPMQMGNKTQNNIKYLSTRVKLENGVSIIVGNKSDDKMEKTINSICLKALLDKKDYDFYVITEKKAKFDSTIEENGINGDDDYILVKKKIGNENENSKKTNDNNIKNNEVIEPIIKGIPINLRMTASTGLQVDLEIGLKNTFKDIAITYCNKINVNPSLIGEKLVFIRNGEKLDLNDAKTLEQIGIKNNYSITVLDQANIIAA